MDDEEFDDFRRSVISPMIERHPEMFPLMHQRVFRDPSPSVPPPPEESRKAATGDKYPGTDRYAPCPCSSGQKHKFCCGKKGR
jgi:hypothetical protein